MKDPLLPPLPPPPPPPRLLSFVSSSLCLISVFLSEPLHFISSLFVMSLMFKFIVLESQWFKYLCVFRSVQSEEFLTCVASDHTQTNASYLYRTRTVLFRLCTDEAASFYLYILTKLINSLFYSEPIIIQLSLYVFIF